ncbi:MAG: YbaK/EbsC family protein [Proteobacteria bacterium]|nr:YbaK/EbsC family protein [Pseudomonadota bacterium]
MALQRLTEYLGNHQVRYSTISHTAAYTSQQIAATAHIPGKMLAKTVIVKLDGKLAMVVIPAHRRIDLKWLRESTGHRQAEIAREYEFAGNFPGCETGAMPPFGNLYGMDVYVDEELTHDKNIAFNAGTHSELIQMAYSDFEHLVKPRLLTEPHH